MAKKKTSLKVASLASKLLRKDLKRKQEKSVAASALSQREKNKPTKRKGSKRWNLISIFVVEQLLYA